MKMTDMSTHRVNERRINWRAIGSATGIGAVVTVVIALALGLAAYAGAASYKSVSNLAAKDHVPLAWLTPAGIDGGLLAVIIFDITLTIIGRPIRGLRAVSRLFAAGVIAANVAAGWPDPAGVGLRLAAPVLFIVIVEAARAFLLRRHDDPESDGIPRIRWLLDFRGTFALWRRMKLWGERSYMRAVGIELERIAAIEELSMKYAPGDWTESAPANLVWMLKAGVRMAEALDRVAELTAPPETPAPAGDSAPTPGPASEGRKPPREKPIAGGRKPADSGTRKRGSDSDLDVDPIDIYAEALKVLAEEPGISGSELGVRLGRTKARGRQIMSRLAVTAPDGIDKAASP